LTVCGHKKGQFTLRPPPDRVPQTSFREFRMDAEVVMGEPEDASDDDNHLPDSTDPDEFFAKHAFRIVYQTNNLFLPQIKDLIEKGDVLNLRPEYQRRLRWTRNQKSKLI
jgi:hypothetical protein